MTATPATENLLSLSAVAERLELPRIRLFRLGRCFHYAPTDPCLPQDIVARADTEADGEARYRMLLDCLLESC
jgi:hypothetical protein